MPTLTTPPSSPTDEERLKESFLEQKRQLEKAKAKEALDADLRKRAQVRRGHSEKARQKEDQLWKELSDAADKLVKEGQNGYDTFVSAMSSLVSFCHLTVAKANPLLSLSGAAFEMIKTAKFLPHPKTGKFEASVEDLVEAYTGVGGDVSLARVRDEISARLGKKTPEPLKLPDLQHNIGFSDQNKLEVNIDNIKRSDGLPLTAPDPTKPKDKTPDQKGILQKALIAATTIWLDTLGYKPTRPGALTFVSKADNSPLTKAQFDALSADPNNGLDKYLTGRFGMSVERAPHP
jgi:hypothetical protein